MLLKDEGKTSWSNSLNIFAVTYAFFRSYTNCTKSEPNTTDEDIISNSTYESQNTNKSSIEENENINKQHIYNIKNFKENIAPKMMKRKLNETKELEQSLVQMGHKISNYMENKVSTADDAFKEFIKIQFNSIPEKDKNLRRKMLKDVLTAPLQKSNSLVWKFLFF